MVVVVCVDVDVVVLSVVVVAVVMVVVVVVVSVCVLVVVGSVVGTGVPRVVNSMTELSKSTTDEASPCCTITFD